MAIKFPMNYPYIVTKKNIKVAVIVFWVTALSIEIVRLTINQKVFSNVLPALSMFSRVLFLL